MLLDLELSIFARSLIIIPLHIATALWHQSQLNHQPIKVIPVHIPLLIRIANLYHLLQICLVYLVSHVEDFGALKKVQGIDFAIVVIVVAVEDLPQLLPYIPFIEHLRHQTNEFHLLDAARAVLVHFGHVLFQLLLFQEDS